jgi:hypothetical protein
VGLRDRLQTFESAHSAWDRADRRILRMLSSERADRELSVREGPRRAVECVREIPDTRILEH